MASITGGSIVWNLDIDDSKFAAKLAAAEVSAKSLGNSISTAGKVAGASLVSNLGTAFDSVSSSLGGLIKGVGAVAIAGSAGLGALGKFGIESAAQIQTAQQSMQVLSGSASDAKSVIGQLYNYVLGKPLTFPDAAAAARTLMGYGIQSKDVVNSMKDLGAVAIVTGGNLGMLSLAYGQVNARGKLMGQEVLQLVDQGVPIVKILADHFHKSISQMANDMQGGTVSAADFNKAISEYVGKLDISKFGNTLDNRIISLKGSLRSLAFSFLGVKIDPVQGFVVQAGGLFDVLSGAVDRAAKNTKTLKPAFAEVGKSLGEFIKTALPPLINGLILIMTHLPEIASALIALSAAFVVAKVAATGFAVANALMAASPAMLWAYLIAGAVTTLVAVFTYLQLRYNIISKAMVILNATGKALGGVFRKLKDIVGELVKVGINVAKAAIKDFDDALNASIDWLKKHQTAIKDTAIVLGIIFGPALIQVAAVAVASAAVAAAAGIVAGIGWVIGAAQATAAWITSLPRMAAEAIVTGLTMVAQAALSGYAWVIKASETALAWIVSFAVTSAQAVATAAIMVAQAAIGGYAWVIKGAEVATAWLLSFASMAGQAAAAAAAIAAEAIIAGITWLVEAGAVAFGWLIAFGSMIVEAGVAAAAMVLAAVTTGIAWLIALGPVILAITAVALAAGLIIKYWTPIREFVTGLWGDIVRRTGAFVGEFVSAGGDIITGILRGLRSAGGAVVDFIRGVCADALGAVKKFFGIHSPSTVMHQQGAYIMQGLANGIAAGAAQAAAAAAEAASMVASGFGDMSAAANLSVATDVTGSSSGGLTGGGGAPTIIQNNNVFDQVDMDRVTRDLAWRARR